MGHIVDYMKPILIWVNAAAPARCMVMVEPTLDYNTVMSFKLRIN